MRSVLALASSLFLAAQAYAADLTVTVTNSAGAPVANAVATFTPATGATAPIQFSWPYQVAQRNQQFDPYILIVPVGATVRFPNFDPVRHHVYSFSAGNRFEIELYGRDESRSHRFTRAGVAAVGCNIHDRMQAYIVIVDTPHVGRTGANGTITIPGASGAGTLRVWHPNLRARGGVMSRTVTLPSSGAAREAFSVQLRAGGHAH